MKINDLSFDRNFDAIRALLSTEENTDGGFGIWNAGTSLSATNVTGTHVLMKNMVFLGFPWQGLEYIGS